jgi:hypothetical protein
VDPVRAGENTPGTLLVPEHRQIAFIMSASIICYLREVSDSNAAMGHPIRIALTGGWPS